MTIEQKQKIEAEYDSLFSPEVGSGKVAYERHERRKEFWFSTIDQVITEKVEEIEKLKGQEISPIDSDQYYIDKAVCEAIDKALEILNK